MKCKENDSSWGSLKWAFREIITCKEEKHCFVYLPCLLINSPFSSLITMFPLFTLLTHLLSTGTYPSTFLHPCFHPLPYLSCLPIYSSQELSFHTLTPLFLLFILFTFFIHLPLGLATRVESLEWVESPFWLDSHFLTRVRLESESNYS